ncbi:hypothetical protein [Enemella sp. A6]|uniref:hypothetical protein n=1 Tax=Enemella sp. A6 TaxID=3440152 RepID=UPI003EBDFF32
MDPRIPPPIVGRDLGAELRALNKQLQDLSKREADRIEKMLAADDLSDEERQHWRGELERFRKVQSTELD